MQEETKSHQVKKKEYVRLTKEQIVQIPTLAKQGISNRQIGLMFGVTKVTIDQWIVRLKEVGYRMPYRAGAKKINLEKIKE